MALSSLAKTLPRWKAWADTAFDIEALTKADYPFPKPTVTFLGAVIQKYRPRNGRASKAFQNCIDQLISGLKDLLIPALVKASMLDEQTYKAHSGVEPWVPLMEVADFNSLIAESQEHQVPVFALTEQQTGQQGAVWDQTKESMENFRKAFDACAERVFLLAK